MMPKICLTLSLLLTLAALNAPAAQARPGGPSFKDWDLNKDGKVTLLEMQSALREQFKKADANQDGLVTAAEILNLMPAFVRNQARKGVEEYIRSQDLNGDGKLALDEVMASAKKRFAEMDRNGDGYLSAEEVKQAQKTKSK